MTERVLEIARAWSNALDGDDYDAAGRWMAPDCRYRMRDRLIHGRESILSEYRDASVRGRAVLDELCFESEVVHAGDESATVRFTDRITHGGMAYVHACEQVLRLSPDGRIVHIDHRDLPGERERLHDFFARVGVRL